jgi:hypothetical protein
VLAFCTDMLAVLDFMRVIKSNVSSDPSFFSDFSLRRQIPSDDSDIRRSAC